QFHVDGLSPATLCAIVLEIISGILNVFTSSLRAQSSPPAKGGSTYTREAQLNGVSAVAHLPSNEHEPRSTTTAMEVPSPVGPVKVVGRYRRRSPNVAGTSVLVRLVWVQPAASRAAAKKCTSTMILILQCIYDFPGISPQANPPIGRCSL